MRGGDKFSAPYFRAKKWMHTIKTKCLVLYGYFSFAKIIVMLKNAKEKGKHK